VTMRVLQRRSEILIARAELEDRGISALDVSAIGRFKAFLPRVGVSRFLVVGDFIKSWDVWATVQFLQDHVAPSDSVLDLGCYASEMLPCLHKAGFKKLTGIDLNPRVKKMPFGNQIQYVAGNFMDCPFEDGSFSALTAVSVIEHGYDGPRLMREVARMLKPGGYFIASFDYWPEKIATDDVKFFGMDWLIFSRQDVEALLVEAARNGLVPDGEICSESEDKTVNHERFSYTFGWLVLRKPA
jgi:SAM-dependent methyltransferase